MQTTLSFPAPNGIPPYLWAVIVAAIVAALAGIGIHIQAPDATPSTLSTECECECATPAPTPDLTTEPLPAPGRPDGTR